MMWATGALSTARRSSARFVRSSCAMPMTAFTARTTPNRPSWGGPTKATTMSNAPRIALKRVSRFARRICENDRLGREEMVLTRPVATRSRTCSASSPEKSTGTSALIGTGAITTQHVLNHKYVFLGLDHHRPRRGNSRFLVGCGAPRSHGAHRAGDEARRCLLRRAAPDRCNRVGDRVG